MFGSLGAPELLFILLLALLIFGPKALPEVGRTLGKGLAELRKASNELKRTINAEVLAEELRESDPRRVVKEALDPFSPPPPSPTPGYVPPPAPPAPDGASPTSAGETASAEGPGAETAEPRDPDAGSRSPEGSVARGALDEAGAPSPTATTG